jgi:hypothetical protein
MYKLVTFLVNIGACEAVGLRADGGEKPRYTNPYPVDGLLSSEWDSDHKYFKFQSNGVFLKGYHCLDYDEKDAVAEIRATRPDGSPISRPDGSFISQDCKVFKDPAASAFAKETLKHWRKLFAEQKIEHFSVVTGLSKI